MRLKKSLIAQAEVVFAHLAIFFFGGVLSFESFFIASEGSTTVFIASGAIYKVLSLLQHSIFLVTVGLLVTVNRKTLIKTLLNRKLVWALIAICSISFLWSTVPKTTLTRSVSLFETMLFAVYFGACFPLQQQLRILQRSFAIAALLSILVSLGLPTAGRELGVHAGSWRGIYAHKNYLAREMALGALLSRMVTPITPLDHWTSRFLLGGSIFLVLMSTSKTGLFILVAVIGFSFVFKTLRLEMGLVLITWVTSSFLITAAIFFVSTNFESIVVSIGRDPTLSGRTIIWGALIDKINLRPWLGYGYEGFWRGAEGESAVISKLIVAYIPPHAHNGFFDLTIAFGLTGLIIFILNLISLLRRSIIIARNSFTQEGIWPLCYCLFILFYNQTESTLVERNSIFWVLVITVLSADFKMLADYETTLEKSLVSQATTQGGASHLVREQPSILSFSSPNLEGPNSEGDAPLRRKSVNLGSTSDKRLF